MKWNARVIEGITMGNEFQEELRSGVGDWMNSQNIVETRKR
jgi:hypothetical protein